MIQISTASDAKEGLIFLRPEAAQAGYAGCFENADALQVYNVLFTRLSTAKTVKYVGGLLGFLSWLICAKGEQTVEASINQMQNGLFRNLLEQVWMPSMTSVKGEEPRKLLLVASTKVIFPSTTQATCKAQQC